MVFQLRAWVRFALVFLVPGVVAGCFGDWPSFDASDRVRNAFKQYKGAVLDRDGKAVAGYVSSRTISDYESWRAAALAANRESLERENVVVQLWVLRARLEFSKAELDRLSGRDLLVSAVERGWISRSSVENSKAGIATIDGDSASLVVDNGWIESRFPLAFEDGEWKLDLSVALITEGSRMQDQAESAGIDRKKFVERLLKESSSKPLSPALWDGPLD